ncbi:MAG: hypothetical protein JW973_07310 [Bacteroidales bacterium]|nr:hypothetical protein [Bacteroidales bacterium]
MLEYLVIVLLIVIASFIFLGFNIFFRRKSFPETEVGHNREMRKLGLSCPKCDEIRIHRKPKSFPKINPDKLKIIRP